MEYRLLDEKTFSRIDSADMSLEILTKLALNVKNVRLNNVETEILRTLFCSFSGLNNLLSVRIVSSTALSYNTIRPLIYCKSLIYFGMNCDTFTDDSCFTAVYRLMKNKSSDKLNLMFTSIYMKEMDALIKTEKIDKAVYLLSLAAREVYNVFFTYTDEKTNKLFFHRFITSLEIMNRYTSILRGVFLGLSHRSYSGFDEHVKIYPLAKYTKYPNSTEAENYNLPFGPGISKEHVKD